MEKGFKVWLTHRAVCWKKPFYKGYLFLNLDISLGFFLIDFFPCKIVKLMEK